MATLTDVSGIARKAIKFGIIGVIVMMILPVVFRGIRNIWTQLHPPPPAAPTVRYGKLPKLDFPIVPEEATPEYVLQTISGGFPQLQEVGKVYLVGINKSRLSSLDRIRDMAKLLGFGNDFVPQNERVYEFIHSKLPATMTADIITWSFTYRYDWTGEKIIYNSFSVPIGNEAVAKAKAFFTQIGLLQDELSRGNGVVKYLAATGSAMIPVDSFYDANFTRVDLYRADKDELRVVTAGGDTTPVNITFSSLGGEKSVVQANFYYSLTIDNDFATYPLKGVNVAWNELVAGKGFVAKKAGQKVIVRKISLAYYESNGQQQFLQPIYVFEGDGGFMGYVGAVRSEMVQ